MPTISQLVRSPRRPLRRRSGAPALRGCPQRRGVVTRVMIRDPKKPNSADRKCCKVTLTTGQEIICYIPGDRGADTIQEHSVVLVRGGGPPDLPGVKYTVIHGGQGLVMPSTGKQTPDGIVKRNQSRSKYGVKMKR